MHGVHHVVAGAHGVPAAGELVHERRHGVHGGEVGRQRLARVVVEVTPLVSDGTHAAVEGDRGGQQAVRVERLYCSACLALQAREGRSQRVEGEIAIHVDAVLVATRGEEGEEVKPRSEESPGVGHRHDHDFAGVEEEGVERIEVGGRVGWK